MAAGVTVVWTAPTASILVDSYSIQRKLSTDLTYSTVMTEIPSSVLSYLDKGSNNGGIPAGTYNYKILAIAKGVIIESAIQTITVT